MKRIYLTLFLALAAVSCQDEIFQPLLPAYDGEMRFDFTTSGARTKAFGDTFVASDVIGLYVTDYVDAETPMPLQISGNRANNLPVTFDGTVWTPRKPVFWGEGKSDVYAYYPYIDEITDVNSQPFTVALDQNTKRTGKTLGGYEASDFLWAKTAGVSQKDSTVLLTMRHCLSKITVKIVAGEDYVGSLPEDASVLVHSTVASARVDLETGAAVKDPYSGAQSVNMKKLGLRKYNGVDAVVYEAIIVPQMLETTVPLFEINSKSVSYLVEDAFNFRPGVAYTYTITLNTSTNAIKVDIGCELEDWNSTGGDNSGDEGEEGEEDEEYEEDGDDAGLMYTNLSAEGTANCYIVSEAGAYKFKAVQGNLDATVGNVKKVEVLWESFGTDVMPDVGDLIATASYKDGYVRFTTPENFTEGNAVIAAKNSAGTILWSWHIWMTDEPEIHMYNNKAGMMMDRNLGATSPGFGEVTSLGLLYVRGRKDPFLGSSSMTHSIEAASTGVWKFESSPNDGQNYVDAAESNPMTFYTNHNYYVWTAEKTTSDPCPVGWRVPYGIMGDTFWMRSDIGATSFDYEAYGMNFNITYPDIAGYPAAGCRYQSTGELMYVGSAGFYHMSAYQGYFSESDFSAGSSDSYWSYGQINRGQPGNAYSVRCYRDYDPALVPELILPEIETSDAVNLAVEGTANSYIVSASGTYMFPTVKGNGSESVGAPVDASVVWESFGTEEKPSRGDLLVGATYQDGMVYFKTVDAFREGNALIAVKDENGTILWSWHIWMTDEPQEQVYYNDAGVMMDRNLGAISAIPGEPGLMGLRYQWGRKDPFMGQIRKSDGTDDIASSYLWPSSGVSPDSPIEYAISHPTVVMGYRNHGDWISVSSVTQIDNTRWQSEKTIYDPCPAGWRVPDGGEESVWYKATNTTYFYSNEKSNFSGVLGDDEYILYPHIGYDYNQHCESRYWTCTPHPRRNENGGINVLYTYGWPYESVGADTDNYSGRAERYYIRCQKQ